MRNIMRKKRGWGRRTLSAMLAVVMVLTMLPALSLPIYAADATETAKYLNLSADGTTIEGFIYNPEKSPTEITIPAVVDGTTITAIGANAFAGCGITKVEFEAGSQIKSIGNNAFQNCLFDTVVLPSTVETIGSSAFYNCINLKSINLPNTVTSIGASAFAYCTALTKIDLSALSLTTINANTFSYCSGLKDAKLPNGLLTIETNAFHECPLNGITIPASVTEIKGGYTFYKTIGTFDLSAHAAGSLAGAPWHSSAKVKWADDPNNNDPTFIFNTQTGMICGIKDTYAGPWDITIPTTVDSVAVQGLADGAFAFNYKITKVDFALGSTITTIPHAAFDACSKLAEVDLPEGITTIKDMAFRSATISKIIFPASLESIGSDAFTFNPALTEVTFQGNKVTSLLNRTFYRCPSLTKINLPEMTKDAISGAPWGALRATVFWKDGTTQAQVQQSKDGLWEYTRNADGTVNLTNYLDTVNIPTDFVVPDKIEVEETDAGGNTTTVEYTVSYVGNTDNNPILPRSKRLDSLTISGGVKSVGGYSFYNVPIDSLVAEEGVQNIGGYAFDGCILSSIALPESTKTIGTYAFRNNALTGEIVLHGNVTSVAFSAFAGNAGITKMTVEQYRNWPSDAGGYNSAQKTYLASPAAVKNNAPFGANCGTYFMDDPKPLFTVNPVVDAANNKVTLKISVIMSDYSPISKIEAGTGSPALTNVVMQAYGIRPTTADMVIESTNGNGSYSVSAASALWGGTDTCAITVDQFRNISYDPNGGSTTLGADNTNYVEGYSKTLPTKADATFTKSGATFIGWSLTQHAGNITNQTDQDNAGIVSTYIFGSQNAKFYAVWAEDSTGTGVPDYQKGKLTVSYDGNGATGTPPASHANILDGTKQPLETSPSALTMAGYTFYGWSMSPSPATVDTKTAAAACSLVTDVTVNSADGIPVYTVYAVWAVDANENGIPDFDENLFHVTYIANGGSGTVPVDNFPYAAGTKQAKILGAGAQGGSYYLTKQYYDFAGWNTKPDGTGTAYQENDQETITSDLILYAQWTAKKFDVVFKDADPATGAATTEIVKYQNVPIDSKVGNAPADPSKTGYVFVGWSDGSGVYSTNAVKNDYIMTTAGVTFTAVYAEAQKAVVIFDYAGGADASGNTTSVVTNLAGKSYTVPTGFTKTGYTFNGWDNAPSGTFGAAGSVTVYKAQWTQDTITVDILVTDASGNALAGVTYPNAPSLVYKTESGLAGTALTVYAPHIAGYVLVGANRADFSALAAGDTATFKYKPILDEFVTVTVKGIIKNTSTELYSYDVIRQKGSGNYSVTAFDVNGYTLATTSPAIVNVQQTNLTQTFEYTTKATTVTIAMEDENHNPIATPITVAATIGESFSYQAPHVTHYNLTSALTQSIASVAGGETLTFAYKKATGNITLVLKEDDTNGAVIKTVSQTLSAGDSKTFNITDYDLSADYYNYVNGAQAHTVTSYDGNAASFEFYYTKQLVNIDIEAQDYNTGVKLGTDTLFNVRKGEYATVSAPSVTNYVLVGSGTQSVLADGTTKAIFKYRTQAQDEVTVKAMNGATLLHSYTIKGTVGEEIEIAPPALFGWQTSETSKTAKVGTDKTVTFQYTEDVFTVTIKTEVDSVVTTVDTVKVPNGGDYTAYAPHVAGYTLDGADKQTITGISKNETVTFKYKAEGASVVASTINVEIRGEDSSGKTLYSYLVTRKKDTNTSFTVDALALNGYTLGAGEAAQVSIPDDGSVLKHVFVYESTDAQVRIQLVTDSTETIYVDAVKGQPFSYQAPHKAGYVLVGNLTQSITAVAGNETLTFTYQKLSGNVSVILKETDTNGAIIALQEETVVANVPTDIDIPTIPNYTALSTAKETVTYDGTNACSVEYYYARDTVNVDIVCYDESSTEIGRVHKTFNHGETVVVTAPSVSGYAPIGSLTQTVLIDASVTEINFDYQTLSNSSILVQAVADGSGTLLQTYTLTGTMGTTAIINAPQIVGWSLVSGEAYVKTAQFPDTVTFTYTQGTAAATPAQITIEYVDVDSTNTIKTQDIGGYLVGAQFVPNVPDSFNHGGRKYALDNVATDLRAITLGATNTIYVYYKDNGAENTHTSSGGGGGGASNYVVTYQANGGKGSDYKVSGLGASDKHTVLTASAAGVSRKGYTFIGWNTKSNGTGTAYAAGSTLTVKQSVTLYAQWELTEDKELLETENHFAYLAGYADGTVRPDKAITRAEACAIFYRLLKNPATASGGIFGDVKGDAWYANAVNALASMGIVSGYADATFKPDALITRAEFATIAAKFSALDNGGSLPFTDVSTKHWAYDYIALAYAKGWVNGYPDATFRPDSSITRAEVITVANAILARKADKKALAQVKNPFKDLHESHWAYANIIEAAVAHEHEKNDDGVESWKLK